MYTSKLIRLFLVAAGTLPGQNATLSPYTPITGEERLKWIVNRTVGPVSLMTGVVSAGIDTWRNSPPEYGPHWSGFGERNGYRAADRTLANSMEAGLGYVWGEDPRYFRVPEKSMGGRIRNVFRMTVITHDRSGREMPAYARFIAVPAGAFIDSRWKPESTDDTRDALNRITVNFVNHIASNAFAEFWPDVRRRISRKHNSGAAPDFVDKFAQESAR